MPPHLHLDRIPVALGAQAIASASPDPGQVFGRGLTVEDAQEQVRVRGSKQVSGDPFAPDLTVAEVNGLVLLESFRRKPSLRPADFDGPSALEACANKLLMEKMLDPRLVGVCPLLLLTAGLLMAEAVSRKLVGILSLDDLLKARIRNLDEERRRERVLRIRVPFTRSAPASS